MYKNLMINPELYVLTFVTQDSMKFDLIRNCIKGIIQDSKKREIFNNNQDKLYVFKENYEEIITTVTDFLNNINREDNVYWSNINGILLPCGYFQVAIATPKIKKSLIRDDVSYKIELKNYCDKISKNLQTEASIIYDYYTDTNIISLKGVDYESSLLNFNSFIKENGIGPFEYINTSSRYGKLESTKYPILSKKK